MNKEILDSLNIGAVLRESEHACISLSFSKDGSALGAGFEDGTVNVIDTESASVVRTHRSHKYGLSQFAFLNQDPSGTHAVAVASPAVIEDYSIRVWDLVNNRFTRIFRFHETKITSVSVHPNKDILISSAIDGNTCIWDLREEKPIWQCRDSKSVVSAFDKLDGSHTFAVSFPSVNGISFFDLRQFQAPMREVKRFTSSADEMCFSADGQKLLVGSWNLGMIATVNTESALVEATYFLPRTTTPYHVSTSSCSRYGIATSPSKVADIWDLKSRLRIRSLAGHDGTPIAAFSPKHLMVATATMPVALWVPFRKS